MAATGTREEAVWVSRTTLTLLANGSDVLSRGTGRWERDVRLSERVYSGLWWESSNTEVNSTDMKSTLNIKALRI